MGADHVLVVGLEGGLEFLGHAEESVLVSRLLPLVKLVQDPTIKADPQSLMVPPYRNYAYVQRLSKVPAAQRPIFAHFRGTVEGHPLRQKLRQLAQQRPHHFFWKEGLSAFYWQELTRSRFILCPQGHVRRLYDALQAEAIPVVIADQWRQIPNQLCLRVTEREAYKLDQILMDVTAEEETALLLRIKQQSAKFQWNLPASFPGDAFEQVMAQLAQRKAMAAISAPSTDYIPEPMMEEEEDKPEEDEQPDFGQLEDPVRVNLQ